ncbi:MAG TPA: hypothetical protein VM243_03585 [Phycisphaerae bacterium]|nr:hypothetical protein [Phycisphaerae bacterium]
MAGWDHIGTVIAVTAPLVGAPLAAITFHVRTLREHLTGRLAALTQRIDHLDRLIDSLARRVREVDRDFVNKEEWIRESMLARGERQRLGEAVVRLETQKETTCDGLAAAGRMDRMARAVLAASQKFESAFGGVGATAARQRRRREEPS